MSHFQPAAPVVPPPAGRSSSRLRGRVLHSRVSGNYIFSVPARFLSCLSGLPGGSASPNQSLQRTAVLVARFSGGTPSPSLSSRALGDFPVSSSHKYQCPCCDYFSLDERGGYDICRICFWEDSGQDLDELDEHSGPNHQTLREARANFRAFLARVIYPHRLMSCQLPSATSFVTAPRPDTPVA